MATAAQIIHYPYSIEIQPLHALCPYYCSDQTRVHTYIHTTLLHLFSLHRLVLSQHLLTTLFPPLRPLLTLSLVRSAFTCSAAHLNHTPPSSSLLQRCPVSCSPGFAPGSPAGRHIYCFSWSGRHLSTQSQSQRAFTPPARPPLLLAGPSCLSWETPSAN